MAKKAEKPQRPPCHHFGPMVGPVKSNCAGSVKAHACFNPQVPSGYCCPVEPQTTKDGPIKLADGKLTKQRYMPMPFNQAAVDKGKEPWDNWILCCDCCPYRVDPPAQIVALYAQRDQTLDRIREYEAAQSAEERAQIVAQTELTA